MVHSVFSIVARVPNDQPVEVRKADLALESIPSFHFASVVVFDRPAGAAEPTFGAHVVLEICADGTVDDSISALLVGERRIAAVVELFRGGAGFPDEAARPHGDRLARDAALRRYLRAHVVTPHLFHIGSPGMRLPHIQAGDALHDALVDEALRRPAAADAGEQPRAILDRLVRRLRVPRSARTHWHLDPATLRTREYAWFSDVVRLGGSRLRYWSRWLVPLGAIGATLVALWMLGGAWAIVAAAATAYLLFRLYWRWLTGGGETGAALSDSALHALTEQEDIGLHNHMASLALLKPGRLRRLAIRAVLHAFNLGYRTIYTDLTPGRLQGLPTIHFAQWSLVRLPDDAKGRRREALMFLSNYDGSWDNYLDDFLEFLFTGVVMIWGNAVTFPSSVTARSFKAWARTQMAPLRTWHDAAYPTLTVTNIHNNDKLRIGLLRPPLTDHAARLWLARLGAVKSGHEQFDDVDGVLPVHDMQGVLLRGYGGLPYAVFALLRFGGDGAAAQQWLRGLLGWITDGRELDRRERTRETEAVNVAFTHRGLQVLGLESRTLDQFPLPFRDGIAPSDGPGGRRHHRSRVLGDTGENAPANWAWGGRSDPARDPDVLLMMYGRTPEEVDKLARAQREAFDAAGAGTVVDVVCSAPIGPDPDIAVEHFGFADGLSQPRIEGTWQIGASPGVDDADTVKPGEFILGYDNNDGVRTPGVLVAAADDPDELLPPARDNSEDARDFGMNGTFLVARQLSQDVAAFRTFTAAAAGVAADRHASHAAEHVAARIVGRWRSGVPLTCGPGATNDLTFASDPHGFGCPVGAHIRRANPRDSLGVDPVLARSGANRRRLLRRGRPYGPALPAERTANDGHARGMMFLTLNADIERQFEFVQQTWINSPVFGGLYAERDPLIGALDGSAHFTVQANPVSARMTGLARFVQVVGGGYFFLPGVRALTYLARPRPAAVRLSPSEPAAVPPSDASAASALSRPLAGLARLLLRLRLVWALRFPVLVALALVLVAFAPTPGGVPSLPLFLTTPAGAMLTGFLASLVAWMVMVTVRLVLMYGTRIGLSRERWTGVARWRHLLAFQVLALPVVVATVRHSAIDAGEGGAAARELAVALAAASAAGIMLGILALAAATLVQSLRRNGRPDLFFPPMRVLQPIVARLQQSRPVQWLSKRITAATGRFVRAVPQDLGVGFIDYRHRRLLPGHAFAAVLAGIVVVVYSAGFVLLNPAHGYGAWVPPIAYVLFVLLAVGWLLSAVAFFLDRYRLPTLLAIALWIVAVAAIARPDHVFSVMRPVEPGARPADIAVASQHQRPGRNIVVASEGYGLASSAWTAEVLTRLADGEHGARFADAVRLISASSGAAVGTLHFADAYRSGGFAARNDRAELAGIRLRARAPSSSEAWWGLAYPDLLRAFVPGLVPAGTDRGWAMEQAWRRALPAGHAPTLGAWRRDVAEGWRPATVFGVTSVETGEQGLLATYRARSNNPDGPDHVTRGRDVSMVTAARLSASFPYVSPPARANVDNGAANHFTDGGFWDNSGVLAALDWIEDAAYEPGSVLLIEIRSSAPPPRRAPENRLWRLEAFGPLDALVAVRYDGQRVRNAAALKRFTESHPIEHAVFDLADEGVPLTWNLGQGHVRAVEAAWWRGDNQKGAAHVHAFLSREGGRP